MKKIGICLMVVLSFILVGNTVYDFRMNSRYSVVQFQPSDMTAAEIKEEFPEIAFSEKDRTLHADVMALPEVQAALAAEKSPLCFVQQLPPGKPLGNAVNLLIISVQILINGNAVPIPSGMFFINRNLF